MCRGQLLEKHGGRAASSCSVELVWTFLRVFEAICSDASLSGIGLCHRICTPEVVMWHGVIDERSRFKACVGRVAP